MPILDHYNAFDGRHWETGSVANYYRAIGLAAPHTGRPPSEALLMGVSGGAVMGYFFFAYEGYDPQVRILTRNTFDPWDRMLSRLGVVQHVRQTANATKGAANLVEILENGIPALVWADVFSLPYNDLSEDAGMWAMMPLIVYGYDETAGEVRIADRARVGLTVTPEKLQQARGRVKKDKFRVLTLEPPRWEKLPAAVTAGIHDSLRLYLEKPPKGSPKNFGFKAFEHWLKILRSPKGRDSWINLLPDGNTLTAGLMSTVSDIEHFGKAGHAERDLFARFLDEATVILERPALNEVAAIFQRAAAAWDELAAALLPEDIAGLGEIRTLMGRHHELFLDFGGDSQEERQALRARITALRGELAAAFPLDESGRLAFQERIAAAVAVVRDLETSAVQQLQLVMR